MGIHRGGGTILAYIMTWEDQRAVDPILWQREPMVLAIPTSELTPVSFLPAVTLEPTQKYVINFSASEHLDDTSDSCTTGITFYSDMNVDDECVFIDNQDGLVFWTFGTWIKTGRDFRIKAVFSDQIRLPADGTRIVGFPPKSIITYDDVPDIQVDFLSDYQDFNINIIIFILLIDFNDVDDYSILLSANYANYKYVRTCNHEVEL